MSSWSSRLFDFSFFLSLNWAVFNSQINSEPALCNWLIKLDFSAEKLDYQFTSCRLIAISCEPSGSNRQKKNSRCGRTELCQKQKTKKKTNIESAKFGNWWQAVLLRAVDSWVERNSTVSRHDLHQYYDDTFSLQSRALLFEHSWSSQRGNCVYDRIEGNFVLMNVNCVIWGWVIISLFEDSGEIPCGGSLTTSHFTFLESKKLFTSRSGCVNVERTPWLRAA